MSEPRLGNRSLFPTLSARAYLNHAAISPLSQPVCDAVQELLTDYAHKGLDALSHLVGAAQSLARPACRTRRCKRAGHRLCSEYDPGRDRHRPEFSFRAGDRVLLFEGEFPANVTPWQQAAKLFQLELCWLKADDFRLRSDVALEALESQLNKGVRLLAVSAVQFQTGLRMPLEAIGVLCKKYDTRFFVDGIQAVGAVPLSVRKLGIDFLSCGGHKWLMGPEGTGFLYVAPQAMAELEPRVAGWLGHERAFDFLFEGPGHLHYDRPLRKTADVFEPGAYAALGLAGLGASVALIQQLTPAGFSSTSVAISNDWRRA